MVRIKGKRIILSAITLAMVAVVSATTLKAAPKPPAVGGPAAPPNAVVYGQTLAEWLSDYWRWYNGTGVNNMEFAPEPYKPGPEPIVFLPMPGWGQITDGGGSWTLDDPGILIGQVHFTIPAGTGFVTPFFAWTAERYADWPAVPDDGTIDEARIQDTMVYPGGGIGSIPEITLDGKPLVRDFWAQYVGVVPLDPPIVYPVPTGYGAVAAVKWQGAGVVVHPLPVGRHILHLYEQWRFEPGVLPGYDGLGLAYDNTWVIDVVPRSRS